MKMAPQFLSVTVSLCLSVFLSLKDRPDGYGGSLLLIKNNIVSEPVDISTECDIVFRKIECSNSQTLIVGSAYRPTNNDVDYTTKLIEMPTGKFCMLFAVC